MGNIVGIHFGLNNCIAAFKFAETQVVQGKDGALVLSVVAFRDNNFIVGKEAYNQLLQDPENVITGIRNLLGRSFSDEIVQQQIKRVGYKITPSTDNEQNISIWLGGKEYQPEDIAAEIIKQVVKNAQAYQESMGKKNKINQAVITVPAYFNDKQRYATEIA
ncbi:Hsp70 family protein, partial [Geminocystis sp. GBBB08]|uniref:Hsp70 family protein n=1 Tax=Geminocystis sp. GBBB08 TaxID=2604140 RepID=UPI0027E39211